MRFAAFMSFKCTPVYLIAGFRFKNCSILSFNHLIILIGRANSIYFLIFIKPLLKIKRSQIHHSFK